MFLRNTAENFETLSSQAKNQLESWRLLPCDPDLANVLFAGFSALLVDMLQCLKGNLFEAIQNHTVDPSFC